MDALLPALVPGKDLILVARPAIATASFAEIQAALAGLVERARLIQQGEGSYDPA